MKKFAVAFGLIVCLSLLFAPIASAQRKKSKHVAQKQQSIRAEAETEARKLVDTFITRCGDSYFVEYKSSNIVEWKGKHMEFIHTAPSLVAKLNGVEWELKVRVTFDAQRRLGESLWDSPLDMLCFQLIKRNGAWERSYCLDIYELALGDINAPRRKLTCESVARPANR